MAAIKPSEADTLAGGEAAGSSRYGSSSRAFCHSARASATVSTTNTSCCATLPAASAARYKPVSSKYRYIYVGRIFAVASVASGSLANTPSATAIIEYRGMPARASSISPAMSQHHAGSQASAAPNRMSGYSRASTAHSCAFCRSACSTETGNVYSSHSAPPSLFRVWKADIIST